MNVFYSTHLPDSGQHFLDEQESRHAAQVLRLKAGDQVMVFNGKGIKALAEIVHPHPKKCEVNIISTESVPRRNFTVHIAIAPTKMNERTEWFLEKAIESGIDIITPVVCDRSERRQINHERFQKVIVAAMKQSMNPWLPVLNPTIGFNDFVLQNKQGYIAHCMNREKQKLIEIEYSANSFTFLIGPEGDFTPAEVEFATKNNFTEVSFGESRLRTETAGLFACFAVNLMKSGNGN